MKAYFKPNSVAIVGASEDTSKLGGMLLKNMIEAGFKGELYPINPKGGTIQGLKAYKSVTEVGKPIELAVVAIKNTQAIDQMKELGEARVKYVSMLTAGFKETGHEGAELEERLFTEARKFGIRIVGPNCFGNMNIAHGMNFTFTHIVPPAGNISVLSQSGALGSSMLDWFKQNNLGIANFMTFGNKSDVNEADVIEYLMEDPQTKVIGIYSEGIVDGAGFIKAIESAKVKKPIVIFKSGKTEAGASAASSHTGALAGSDAVNDVIFKKLNLYRANDFDEMLDALAVFSTCSPMKKDGIAIITNAGGLGVMSADAASEAEFVCAAKLAEATNDAIIAAVPTIAGLTNPIDVRGDAKAEYFGGAINAAVRDESVGGLIIMASPLDTADLEAIARQLVEMRDDIPVPTTICFAGGEKCDKANKILREGLIPCYSTPHRAVRALNILRKYSVVSAEKKDPMIKPDVSGKANAEKIIADAKRDGRKALTESEGKKIFAAYGMSTPGEATVTSADDAVKECNRIGYPVVMKILSPDIAHKTDVGGVVVGVKNADEAKAAYDNIMANCKKAKPNARLDGVSIQQMVFGQEVILSMIRDEQFGPVISFGLGGIYVEIMGEISQAHVPMTEQQLDRMITSTKAYKLLAGARGLPEADIDAVKDMIRRIVTVAVENPEIHELEINPVIVGKKGTGCWAVDALCTLK